jgi:serine kinase of HPr protein (carbohydrate metabolism regulator)
MPHSAENIHATAVSIGGFGVIICGSSGRGKSDLALRLIDRGAVLISDDRVIIEEQGGCPVLHPAANINGLIEVRGIGILAVDYTQDVPLKLQVNLADNAERFVESIAVADVAGYPVHNITLCAFEASAAIKVELALKSVVDPIARPVAKPSAESDR